LTTKSSWAAETNTAFNMATRQGTRSAYEVSRRVYQGALTPSEGARHLNAEIGMNSNSARDHFYVYRQLRAGSVFHRGLSVEDMDYYLTSIGLDEGSEALRLALQSLWLHIGYYEDLRKFTMRSMRSMLVRHEQRARAPKALLDLDEAFAAAVKRSQADSPEERRRRLAQSPRLPRQLAVVTVAFLRNPDVVAEVLDRAAGICERCSQAAPFRRRKDDSPYLEVHHRQRLADGGEDTVENAIALCPTCHREVHYGHAGA
jgi:5-methylcytosine-specific restriction protein A